MAVQSIKETSKAVGKNERKTHCLENPTVELGTS